VLFSYHGGVGLYIEINAMGGQRSSEPGCNNRYPIYRVSSVCNRELWENCYYQRVIIIMRGRGRQPVYTTIPDLDESILATSRGNYFVSTWWYHKTPHDWKDPIH
jgi:hypothetical protein